MKRVVTVLTFLLLLIAACKKDPPVNHDDNNHNPNDSIPHDTIPGDTFVPYRPSWPMVKEVSYMYAGSLNWQRYYYDSIWRLVKTESFDGTTLREYFYAYSATEVYWGSYRYYSLNANGLVDYQDMGGFNYINYGFNPDSQLISKSGDHFGDTYSWNWLGNMSSDHGWTENGGWSMGLEDNTHTYNTHLNTIGNYNTGQYYLGHSSVNLREHTVWHRGLSTGGGGGNNGFIHYNYTYNDSGWVSQMDVSNGQIIPTQIDSVTIIYDTTYTNNTSYYTYY